MACLSNRELAMRYDLVVIGSSLAGLQGALAAAELDRRVALVDDGRARQRHASSQDFRLRVMSELLATCLENRALWAGAARPLPEDLVPQLLRDTERRIEDERQALIHRAVWSGVDYLDGAPRFVGPNELQVTGANDTCHLTGHRFLLANGANHCRPTYIPFDGHRVVDPAEVAALEWGPRSVIVVGGSTEGLALAVFLATLGTRVTVVDGSSRLLTWCDRDLVGELLNHCRSIGISFCLGADAVGVARPSGTDVAVVMANGRQLAAEAIVWAAGRQGHTQDLNLRAAGLGTDERGRVWCDVTDRTWVEHIYATGDVVGFPARRGSDIEQGRRAAGQALGRPLQGSQAALQELWIPPHLAMAGQTEDELLRAQIPYEMEIIRWSNASGLTAEQDGSGILKLLSHRESGELLGVHTLGDATGELAAIGRSVLRTRGRLTDFTRELSGNPQLTNRLAQARASRSGCRVISSGRLLAESLPQPARYDEHVVLSTVP